MQHHQPGECGQSHQSLNVKAVAVAAAAAVSIYTDRMFVFKCPVVTAVAKWGRRTRLHPILVDPFVTRTSTARVSAHHDSYVDCGLPRSTKGDQRHLDYLLASSSKVYGCLFARVVCCHDRNALFRPPQDSFRKVFVYVYVYDYTKLQYEYVRTAD